MYLRDEHISSIKKWILLLFFYLQRIALSPNFFIPGFFLHSKVEKASGAISSEISSINPWGELENARDTYDKIC